MKEETENDIIAYSLVVGIVIAGLIAYSILGIRYVYRIFKSIWRNIK